MSGNLAELVGIDIPTRLLIGGEWTGGHGGGTLPVIDPATGGRAPERRGYYYQPTVIDQVPWSRHPEHRRSSGRWHP